MATPTAQDLIDALDRLTKALAALLQKQAQQSSAGGGQPAGPGQGTTPAGGGAPTSPHQNPHQAGRLRGTVSRLSQAYKALKSARETWQTVRQVRGLARAGRWRQALKVGRAGFGRLFGAGRGVAGAAGAAEGAGAAGAAGAAASGVGAAVAAIVLAVEAFKQFKDWTIRSTEALQGFHQQLAEVSPSMAMVMQRRLMADIQRDIRKGEALAASAERLTEAESRRKNAFVDWEIIEGNVKNWVMTLANDVLTGLVNADVFKKAAEEIKKILGLDDNETSNLAEQIEKEANAELQRRRDAKERIRDLHDRQAQIIDPIGWAMGRLGFR